MGALGCRRCGTWRLTRPHKAEAASLVRLGAGMTWRPGILTDVRLHAQDMAPEQARTVVPILLTCLLDFAQQCKCHMWPFEAMRAACLHACMHEHAGCAIKLSLKSVMLA